VTLQLKKLRPRRRVRDKLIFVLPFAILLAGCTPPGPRALLEGKRLLDQGEFPKAIAKLKSATTLMKTNAQAWNYLGIAYQRAGQATNAADAYQRALVFDHDLVEARFNLGCLWLEQNKPELAKAELTSYTLRRREAVEGWLKLGAAQLRTRELNSAEKSFNEALRLNPQNAEALNGLGLVLLQRNRARDAAQSFSRALQQQPKYRPALLNLAIVSHQHLNNRVVALEKYREYLALTPRPSNWEAVHATARALEQELAAPAPARPTPTNVVVPANTNPAPTPKPTTNAGVRASPPPKAEPATNVTKSAPMVQTPVPAPASANFEVVKLPPEPVIKTTPDTLAATAPTPPPPVETRASNPPVALQHDAQVAESKGGFFQRINPLNLFHRESKPEARVTPLPNSGERPRAEPAQPTPKPASAGTEAAATTPTPPQPEISRYPYRSPPKPGPGNRHAAERFFAQGVQAQRANHLPDAMQAYRQATQLDPAYFEAYYNLALATAEAGNAQQALSAYEYALAVRPDSSDARYNFALVLKQAAYLLDAANELEKVCAEAPNDSRAHLALGNLYAQQLHQPAKAREHYRKVLETDPRHPQATAIRFWLSANPP
jgi:tetratricopeptide (TPR) repeat protein